MDPSPRHAQYSIATSPSSASHTFIPPHSTSPAILSQQEEAAPSFGCNICCSDVCYDPVVTACGHLFCWPCLYHCLFLQKHHHRSPSQESCPVCEQNVYRRVIPLYGSGKVATPDILAHRFPGINIPCRPSPPLLCRSQSPCSSPISYGGSEHEHAVRLNPRQFRVQPSNLGILRVLLNLIVPLLPSNTRHLLGRARTIFLLEQRRFVNEKEFVLHWGIIFLLSFISLGFLLC